MSNLAKEMCVSLGELSENDLLQTVRKLATLDQNTRNVIATFLQESTQTDLDELTVIQSILNSSGPKFKNAAAIYNEYFSALKFLHSLEGHPSVLLLEENGITVEIRNPKTDITIEFIAHYRPEDPKSFRIVFLVTITVSGFGSAMQFKAQVALDDYTAMCVDMWLDHIASECRQKWVKNPPFSSGTKIMGARDVVNQWLDNPTEENLVGIVQYFTLLERFLGDFRQFTQTYTSQRVYEIIDHLLNRLQTLYNVGKTVPVEIVDGLYRLDTLLGFTCTYNCIAAGNVNVNNKIMIVIAKTDTGWVRKSKNSPEYKQVLLSKQLQQ